MDSTSRPLRPQSPSEPAPEAFLADIEEAVAGLAAADPREVVAVATRIADGLAAALEEEQP